MELIKRFAQEEEGSNAVEYALLVGLIGLAIVAAVKGVGAALTTGYTSIGATVTNSVP